MIEPVSVPILLDLELEEEELDLSVEEAEEYAAQIGSLITISEVYGGLPSGGNSGDIIIKNSEEDYDASWYAPASVVEDGNGLPVTSEAVYDAVSVKYTKPSDGIPAGDLAERAISSRIWWTNGQIIQRLTMKTILISQLNNNTPAPDEAPLVPRVGDIVVGPKGGATDGVPRYLYIISGFFKGAPSGDLAILQDFALSDYNGAYIGPLKVSELQNDSGFGTYSKPSSGIPKTDLAAAVQASLSKADTALQSYIETDPTVPSWAKSENPPTEVFWAEYGVTTGPEILEAYNAGKEIMCKRKGRVYRINTQPSKITGSCSFVYVDANNVSILYATCNLIETTWQGAAFTISHATQASDLGAYELPSGGIPKTDLASAVQTSLGKADTALQSVPSTYRPAAAQDIIDAAQDSAIAAIKGIYWCIYGTTTNSEIQAALDNGVLPVALRGNNCYTYDGYTDSQGHSFIRSTLTDLYRIYCKDNVWYAGSLGIPQLSSTTPKALGTASAGSANRSSKADHVHPMPTAADVGAIAAPEGGSVGQVLKKTASGTEWADESGGGGTVDDDFSTTSENPVQNKVITNAVITMRGQMIELGNALVTKYTKPSGGIPASDLASDVHLIPAGGTVGQLIMKKSAGDYDIEWVSPANTAEQDNTLPITSAGVYMEIGNINALLSTI